MEGTRAFAALNCRRDWRRRKLFAKSYSERRQSSQSQILSPNDRIWFQSQIRCAPRQRFESKLAFDARQRRAEAEVAGPAKCQMPIVRAPKVETIGIGKSFRVTIAGAHHRDHSLTFANLFATEFGVLRTDAGGVLAGTFVTQQLLDRRGNQG